MDRPSTKKNTGLGKGLSALIPGADLTPDGTLKDQEAASIVNIPIHLIVSNPFQPRKEFDEQALTELKNSIVENGLVQPITVRKVQHGYELIAGERRYRACKMAGYETIPAYIRYHVTDEEMLEMALIENVQREKLNPIELAEGYQQLIDTCQLTQDDVAKKIGKDRSTITNIIRLLKLPPEIQESLKKDQITIGHGRALLALDNVKLQLRVWQKIIDENLSVRATEQAVKETTEGPQPKKTSITNIKEYQTNHHIKDIEDRLRMKLGTKVKLKHTKNGGSIEIEYYSNEDLDRLLELFDSIKD